jgi:hypothetical protein
VIAVDKEHAINRSGPEGVPAKDMLGYVQLTNVLPMGPTGHSELLAFAGRLGGAIDCTLDIGTSGQKMRQRYPGVTDARPHTGPRRRRTMASFRPGPNLRKGISYEGENCGALHFAALIQSRLRQDILL